MWTKICGVRDEGMATRIAELGPSAIGLNFFARSRRSVAPDSAVRIAASLPERIARVGLFVNHSLQEVLRIVQLCRLDLVQLHGDEPAEFLAQLKQAHPDLACIRAIRVPDKDDQAWEVVDHYLDECRRWDACPWALLLDAFSPGQYGGTGKKLRWDRIAAYAGRREWPRLIVSGGLTPENVGQAIQMTRPFGVDVASGVEDTKGQQDLELIRGFLKAAQQPGGIPYGADSTGRPTDG